MTDAYNETRSHHSVVSVHEQVSFLLFFDFEGLDSGDGVDSTRVQRRHLTKGYSEPSPPKSRQALLINFNIISVHILGENWKLKIYVCNNRKEGRTVHNYCVNNTWTFHPTMKVAEQVEIGYVEIDLPQPVVNGHGNYKKRF